MTNKLFYSLLEDESLWKPDKTVHPFLTKKEKQIICITNYLKICADCKNHTTYFNEILNCFLCNHCSNVGALSMISATSAKKQFRLTESVLSRLPCIYYIHPDYHNVCRSFFKREVKKISEEE